MGKFPLNHFHDNLLDNMNIFISLILFLFLWIQLTLCMNAKVGEKATIICEPKKNLPIKKCIFTTPDGRSLVVKKSLKGRIQCYCKDVKAKCGIVINKVRSDDEGRWTCQMNIRGERGKMRRTKKRINLVVEDEDEYYDDDFYYDQVPPPPPKDPHYHPKDPHYHYKTTTSTTTTTTTSECEGSGWKCKRG